MQGSKYIQSNIEKCYKDIEELLKNDKIVLFSGTPCQCEAVSLYFSNFLKGKYRNNLISVGVICHGIASPSVWKSYKRYLEKKHNDKLVSVNFRDKTKKGYKKCYCKYTFLSGKELYQPTFFPGSKYIESTIVYNLGLRNSCENCVCKGFNKSYDIILGDWYASYKGKGKYGTSCIVTMTNRGLDVVKQYLPESEPFDIEQVIKDNNFIVSSVKINKKNEQFMSNLDKEDFWDNVEKFYPPKYKYKRIIVKIGLYNILKKIIKKIG